MSIPRFVRSRLPRPTTRFVAIAALATASLVLSGCVAGATGAGAERPDQTTDTVVFGTYSDITSLDKQAVSGRPARFILSNAYDSLVNRDTQGKLVPHILTKWTYDSPTHTWTLTARDDIDFSDGEHLTAEDIKASLDRISAPGTKATLGKWWDIKSTTVTGKYTVQVVTNKPNPLAMIRGDDTTIMPKSWVDKIGDVPYTGTTPPPGVGAYILTQWKQDDEIVFKANPNYFLGKPKIKNLIFRVIPDPSARVAALLAGDVDSIYPVSPDEQAAIDANPDVTVDQAQSTNRARLIIDSRVAPWSDPKVREAVNLAIDRQSIIKSLLPGAVEIAGSLIPQERGFDPDLKPYPYDPDKAKKLLAEAGYPNGIGPVELSVDTEQLRNGGEAQAVADQLAKVGIKVNVKEYDPGDFDTKKINDNPPLSDLGPLLFDGHSGGQTFDGSFFYTYLRSCEEPPDPEFLYYCNSDAKATYEQSIELAASDPDKSTALLQQVEKDLYDDYWDVPLWQEPDLYGDAKNLDWKPDLSGQTLGFLASWK
ncbi:MAG TPA: ABC transporter substrate-binding protein [Steroidobacteraceae bacterium]|jgi:peptide/nickel transport system substrate-binding protein